MRKIDLEEEYNNIAEHKDYIVRASFYECDQHFYLAVIDDLNQRLKKLENPEPKEGEK